MGEIRYIISDASKRVEVEQHTLRYWESELELPIPRNEMGHRYYREEDIELLKVIKALKEKGYQLRAIKILLPEIHKRNHLDTNEVEKVQKECDMKYLEVISGENNVTPVQDQSTDMLQDSQDLLLGKSTERLEQFKEIMGKLISDSLKDNNEALSYLLSDAVSCSVIKEMDYLLRVKEEREEERYKKFDRTIREIQNSRGEYAATKMDKSKKKTGLFRKANKFGKK